MASAARAAARAALLGGRVRVLPRQRTTRCRWLAGAGRTPTAHADRSDADRDQGLRVCIAARARRAHARVTECRRQASARPKAAFGTRSLRFRYERVHVEVRLLHELDLALVTGADSGAEAQWALVDLEAPPPPARLSTTPPSRQYLSFPAAPPKLALCPRLVPSTPRCRSPLLTATLASHHWRMHVGSSALRYLIQVGAGRASRARAALRARVCVRSAGRAESGTGSPAAAAG